TVPSEVSALQVVKPSTVSGTFTATLSAILRTISASRIIPSWSSATTSAAPGPSTIPQISSTTSRKLRPALWISDGLVVTPSTSPVAARSRISAVSAVSTKNFISGWPWAGGIRHLLPSRRRTRESGEDDGHEVRLGDRRFALGGNGRRCDHHPHPLLPSRNRPRSLVRPGQPLHPGLPRHPSPLQQRQSLQAHTQRNRPKLRDSGHPRGAGMQEAVSLREVVSSVPWDM